MELIDGEIRVSLRACLFSESEACEDDFEFTRPGSLLRRQRQQQLLHQQQKQLRKQLSASSDNNRIYSNLPHPGNRSSLIEQQASPVEFLEPVRRLSLHQQLVRQASGSSQGLRSSPSSPRRMRMSEGAKVKGPRPFSSESSSSINDF